jgi:hypothetical protein
MRIGENTAVNRSALTDNPTTSAQSGTQGAQLPDPFYPSGPPVEDVETAIARLEIESSHEKRASADGERAAGEKAQEAALGRKIDKMRELADDTFAQGIVEGAFQGLSAAAAVGSAAESYSSSMSEVSAKGTSGFDAATFSRMAATSARTSKLIDASSRAMSAAGTLWSAAEKSGQERDREGIAVLDRDIERAKGRVDGASTQSKRAEDDVRQTMDALRQYIAAKNQAAQASILKA